MIRKFLCILCLVFCLFNLVSLNGRALAAEKVTIAYGYRSNTMMPLWMAADAGYFHKYSLDVDIVKR